MRHFDVASKSATRICTRFFRTCNKPPVISRVHDVTRLRNWVNIGWRHLERITHKQSCVTRFIGHWCILEHLHFVRAVSHSLSAHIEALLLLKDKSSSDENDDLATTTIDTDSTRDVRVCSCWINPRRLMPSMSGGNTSWEFSIYSALRPNRARVPNV